MAIKVTQHGQKPEDKVYKGECTNCHAKMEWLRSDAKTYHSGDQRDGEFAQITCPECGSTVSGYPPATRPVR